MASTYTPNLHLEKPDGNDDISVLGINANADILDALLASSTGNLSIVSGNISSAERSRYAKFGKVVVIGLTFTVSNTISGSTDVLFSGAPNALQPVRAHMIDITSQTGKHIRVEINGSGYVTNAYTPGGIPAGQYEGSIAYICT